MPVPNESMAARILESSTETTPALAAADLPLPFSDVSSILGLRVTVPQRVPAEDTSDSRPQGTAPAAPAANPQPPAEPVVPEAGTMTPDLTSPSPEASATSISTPLAALPRPLPTRPEGDSVPTLRERVKPSERVQSPAESPLRREDKAPKKGMNLRGADLRGSDLRGADLQGADLTGARLAWARLTGAKLQGATLQRADLTEADLWMADLRGADLQKADLRRAKLTPGQQGAKEEEAAVEAFAMVQTPGETRPEIPTEMVLPRRDVAEQPREEDPR